MAVSRSPDATAYRLRPRDAPVGAQMLLTAFGALVLVPLLTGLDANVALFTAGLGTLIFQLVTGGQVPVFLASSFAFIPVMIHGVATWGVAATLSGLAAAGVLYVLLAALVRWRGAAMVRRLFPPLVIGPVILVIGLLLAPIAVNMFMGRSGDGSEQVLTLSTAVPLALTTLAITIGCSLFAPGLWRLLPILTGIAVGWVGAAAIGVVDWEGVARAPWLAVPRFVTPVWSWPAILAVVPVAIAPMVEHFGDILAIGSVTGKDYVRQPGLDRTLLGDGLATLAAAFVGGPPNTTYSEVTGAVTLTRAFNPAIMTWAALCALALSFCGKVGALLASVPLPVMGGVLVLLFGAIAAIGLDTLTRAQLDLTEPRNLIVVGTTLVLGIGGMTLELGAARLEGVALAALAGILLDTLLPRRDPSEHRPDDPS